MGYEYEMLHAFAKYLKVDLQIIVAKDMNDIFESLQTGEVDIAVSYTHLTLPTNREV